MSDDAAKRRAWKLLNDAVARGDVQRPDRCADCGAAARVDGHHADYDRPLDVVWLCRTCHHKLDGMNGAKASCRNGHPLDDANTYVIPGGSQKGRRRCRACMRVQRSTPKFRERKNAPRRKS